MTVNVFQRLYLTSRQLWKIGQFFRCIGAPRGENGKTVINWAMVEGAQGWAKVKKRTYEVQQGEHKGESRETNDIEFFCAPEETEKAWRAYCAQNGEDPDAIIGEIETFAMESGTEVKSVEVASEGVVYRYWFIPGDAYCLCVTAQCPEEAAEGHGARMAEMVASIAFAA